MPGYSGTPLAKKLGARQGFRVYLTRVPTEVLSELRTVLAECERVPTARGPLDFGMVFARSRSELVREFGPAAESLAPAGMLWACWPKKASGVATDLDNHGVPGERPAPQPPST